MEEHEEDDNTVAAIRVKVGETEQRVAIGTFFRQVGKCVDVVEKDTVVEKKDFDHEARRLCRL